MHEGSKRTVPLPSNSLRVACVGLTFTAVSLAPAPAVQAAGTAFAVDTAEVGEPGNCKAEAWTSWARNHDGLVTANPSCIVQTLTPTELSMQLIRARADDEWSTGLS